MRPKPSIRFYSANFIRERSGSVGRTLWKRRRTFVVALAGSCTVSALISKPVLSLSIQSAQIQIDTKDSESSLECVLEDLNQSSMDKTSNEKLKSARHVSASDKLENSGEALKIESKQEKYAVGPGAQAACGAIAGAVARCLVAPLDVVKIRLQVQLEPVGFANAKYKSLAGTVATILKEEGIVGLWRGTLPAVMFWMPYTAVQFAALGQVNQFTANNSVTKQWDPSARAFVGGAVAGAAATVTSYPLDLIRTNIAAQGEPKVYHSMFGAARSILRQRGVGGLYAGLTPTLLEIIPHSGFQFGSYDLFKRLALWMRQLEEGRDEGVRGTPPLSTSDKFWCGFAAGSVAKAVVHPLDVVKKRFQVAGLMRNPAYGQAVSLHTYTGLADAFRKILQQEGVRGLFKGLTPNLLKAAPSSAITLAVYEFIIGLLSGHHSL